MEFGSNGKNHIPNDRANVWNRRKLNLDFKTSSNFYNHILSLYSKYIFKRTISKKCEIKDENCLLVEFVRFNCCCLIVENGQKCGCMCWLRSAQPTTTLAK